MFEHLKKDIINRYKYLIDHETCPINRQKLILDMRQELRMIAALEGSIRPSEPDYSFSLN